MFEWCLFGQASADKADEIFNHHREEAFSFLRRRAAGRAGHTVFAGAIHWMSKNQAGGAVGIVGACQLVPTHKVRCVRHH